MVRPQEGRRSSIPRYASSTRWRERDPSDRQIRKLIRETMLRFERATDQGVVDWVKGTGIFALDSNADVKREDKGPKLMGAVSDRIDWVMRFPLLPGKTSESPVSDVQESELPAVPAGRYAVQGMGSDPLDDQWFFYRVDKPSEGKWAGHTFVKRGHGGGEIGLIWERIDRAHRDRALERIVQTGISLAAKRFGEKTDRCCRCGRSLTDKVSLAASLGPECVKKGLPS